MKKLFWCALILAIITCLLLPVSAAENAEVTKGKQIATDAAKMAFPTDGSTFEAVCPVHGKYTAEKVTLLEDIYHGYIHIASGTDGIMSVETE